MRFPERSSDENPRFPCLEKVAEDFFNGQMAFMIKDLVLLGIVAAGLVAVGVIRVQQNGNNLDVTIDERKLEATTQEAIRQGEVMLQKAAARPENQPR